MGAAKQDRVSVEFWPGPLDGEAPDHMPTDRCLCVSCVPRARAWVGLDAGSKFVGWAVLEELDELRFDGLPVVAFRAGGVVDAPSDDYALERIKDLLLDWQGERWHPYKVAVECPASVHGGLLRRGHSSVADACLQTNWIGGRLYQAFGEPRGFPRRVGAITVRAQFVEGRPRKGKLDSVLRAAADQQIARWPAELTGKGDAYTKGKLRAKCWSHVVDAALAALWLARRPRKLAPVPKDAAVELQEVAEQLRGLGAEVGTLGCGWG